MLPLQRMKITTKQLYAGICLCWVGIGLAGASVVLAQTSEPLDAPGSMQSRVTAADATLPRVEVVTPAESDDALRRRESIAKSVYGRDELDRHGDIDLADVLNRLPGVSMDSGSPRLRGLGGGYTQILVNGEPAPPGFSMESLAPGDVERIEVIKGATAEFSGVAGTINVILREPPKTLQREWRANANYRAMQPGGTTAFQWGDRVGDLAFVIAGNLGRSAQGTDFDSERISRTPAGEVRAQAIAGRDETRSGSAQLAPRLQWKWGNTDTVMLNGFIQQALSISNSRRTIDDRFGTPSVTVQDQSEANTDTAVQRLQFQWHRKWSDGSRIELKSSWQDTSRKTVGDYLGWRADTSPSLVRHTVTRFDEVRSSVGGRWSQPVGVEHSLLLGWEQERRQRDELRRVWDNAQERIDSSDGMPFAAHMERSVFFMQDEWSMGERWSMLPGLRLERLLTRSSQMGSEMENVAHLTAPVLHINFRLDPKGKDQIRASLSRSFKFPELASLMGRYVLNTTYERDVTNTPIAADRAGNPSLRPEIATGFDLAYEHYPEGGGVLSVGLFSRHIDDLIRQRISLETVADANVVRWVSRPDNLGQAVSRGFEMELKGRAEDWLPAWFGRDSGVQLRSTLSMYTSHVEQVDGPDNRLEAQPPWSLSLGWDRRIKNTGWTVGASAVLRPGYATQQTDRQLARRSALRTLDAFAMWRMDRNIQLRIGLVNLLAPDSETSQTVDDVDGFSAGSTTRRPSLRALNVGLVVRF
jgi:iron complex outermembrane receptor protein